LLKPDRSPADQDVLLLIAASVPVSKSLFKTNTYDFHGHVVAPWRCVIPRRCPELAGAGPNWRFRPDSPLVFCVTLRYQHSMAEESIESIAKKLADALPQGLRSIGDDLEKNFRAVLRSSLAKLDLVTREEFEVQEAVLAHTREKLQALEQRLQALESAGAKKTARKKKASKKTD
jgi:BMFP domain-containing protein YqiC